jgi:membrane protein DedA with SNARE-associated domain/rhodanese-related sulfurtransferase
MNAVDSLVRYGYLVIFGAVFAEQIGLPFPSEPFLLAGGGLAGSGRLSLVLAVGLAALASLIGDTFWYWLGRSRGPRVMSWLCRMSLEPDSCVRRTQGIFDRYGAKSLVVAKFVPGLSTIAPPLAGVVQMPLRHFVAFSALAGVFWAGAYLVLGWLFSAQLEMVAAVLDELGSWTFALLAVAIGGYVGRKYVSRRRFLKKINVARITPEELKTKLDSGEDMIVVDVRDRVDFQAEPAIIPGALHMTVDELDARHQEIPRERDIVLYCTCPSEETSARAALLLRRRGIERIRPLAGGYHGWRDRGYPMTGLTARTNTEPAKSLTLATSGGTHA